MKHLTYPRAMSILLGCSLLLLLFPSASLAATLTLSTESGTVGDTVNVAVDLSSLSPDVLWSYEFDVTWNAAQATLVGVSTVGTLSSAWSVNHSAGSGTVTVAAAGGSSITTDGTLVYLEFLLGPVSGTMYTYLGSAVLNEGSPVPTLVNGSVAITALPTISVYPNSGLIAVGDSLLFSTSGGTPPYSYFSSNPLIADFNGVADWLYGLSPGFVQVTSQDAALIEDTTTGFIEVRAFRLYPQPFSATQGDTVLVPIILDDPTGFGVVSGEIDLSWSAAAAELLDVEIVGASAGAAGWSTPTVLSAPGSTTIAMAGTSSLASPGAVVFLKMVVQSSFYLYVDSGLFNETMPALTTYGYMTVTALPSLSVSPGTANLLVGDLQSFTVNGGATPPLVWSVDDPAVASIDASGNLTALTEGTVYVHLQDALSAEATSGAISVCSLALPAISTTVTAPDTVLVPVTVDRIVTALDIYSYEVTLTYNPAVLELLSVETVGTLSQSWGSPIVMDSAGVITVVHAGGTPLVGCGPSLFELRFRGLSGVAAPSLSSALFNEGSPCARINQRTACIPGTAAPPVAPELRLWPSSPNPFNLQTQVRFRVDRPGNATLDVFSIRGQFVRRLWDQHCEPGRDYFANWDAQDKEGRVVSSGVYFMRLTADGQSRLEKVTLLK